MSGKMTTQEAVAAVSKLVQAAQAAITEAEAIADAHDFGFSIDIGGYGMGGWYSSGDWQSSSSSC